MAGADAAAGPPPLTYAGAGVDIDAADAAVDAMRDLVASTTVGTGALGAIGGYGGLFELPAGYRRPVLVSSTDGVGTKLAVATAAGRLDSIGIDLVAMCVDDLVCCGARPLLFLDYQLLGRVDPDQVRQVMTGIAEGCRQAGIAIVGGELAEHPGLLAPGELDLAGFAVGVVERNAILDGPARCQEGDALLALPSPGLRSNGYSLARAALLERAGRPLDGPAWDGATHSLADELLVPSVIYSPAIGALLAPRGQRNGWAHDAAAGTPAPPGHPAPDADLPTVDVHAVAHITGGGLPGNLPRVLPDHLDAEIDPTRWSRPRIFDEIAAAGGVEEAEMRRVFNLGVGMVVVLPVDEVAEAVDVLAAAGHEPVVIGRLVPGRRQVRFTEDS